MDETASPAALERARSNSVKSLVFGVLAASVWAFFPPLALVSIFLAIIGMAYGGGAREILPPEQNMTARAGYAISLVMLIMSIFICLFFLLWLWMGWGLTYLLLGGFLQ